MIVKKGVGKDPRTENLPLVIEVEGVDGVGKTTAFKYIKEKLAEKFLLTTFRENGNELVPECLKLRQIVLDPESNLSNTAMEMLFSAMRVENKAYLKGYAERCEQLRSDKQASALVDRGWLSHLAYTDHNVSKEFSEQFYGFYIKSLTYVPNYVIYLEAPREVTLARRADRGLPADKIEAKGDEFQGRVKSSFEQYIEDPTNYANLLFRVDASGTKESVAHQLDQAVDAILADLGLLQGRTEDTVEILSGTKE